MKTQNKTDHDPRKLKFAEGAIAFVLLLGLTLAVGLGVSSRNDESAPNVAVAESVEETLPAAVAASTVVEADPVETAVAAVVESAPLYDATVPAADIYRDGERAYHERRFDEAVEILDVYVERKPENAWGWYMLGLSSWKAGDDAFAEDAFLTALELKPDHVKSRVNLARVLLAQDRADEALPQVEAALTASPEYTDAYRVLGRTQHALQDVDAAVLAYEEVLLRDADDVWALNNLGLIRIETGEYDAAIAPLARAATLANQACIHNNLGVALEKTGRRDQAAEAYAAALAADAGYDKAGVSLARVRAVTGPQEAPFDLAALAAGFTPRAADTVAATPADSLETVGTLTETAVSLADLGQ